MFLKPIGLVALALGGFGLGRAHPTLHNRSLGLTVLLATVFQAALKLTLPHGAIEEFAREYAFTGVGPFVLTCIALVETAGLWIPVLLLRWGALSARMWATLCLAANAVLSAAVYYFPFDVVILNGEVVGPTHPEYELNLLLLSPVAIFGLLLGAVARRKYGTVKTA